MARPRRNDKAIADYTDAIRLDPNLARAYTGRASAWYHKREFGKTIADSEEAVRLDPDDDYSLYSGAWLMATCAEAKYRDGKKAVAWASKACGLTNWNDPVSLSSLAAAKAEQGEFDAAVRWQSEANELYSDDEDKQDGEARLALYKQRKPYRDTGG